MRGAEGHTNYGQCIDGFQYVTYPGGQKGQQLKYNGATVMNMVAYDSTTNPTGRMRLDNSGLGLNTEIKKLEYGKGRCAALAGCNFFEMSSSGSSTYNFNYLHLPMDSVLGIPIPTAEQIQNTPSSTAASVAYPVVGASGTWTVANWYHSYHLFVKCSSNSASTNANNICQACEANTYSIYPGSSSCEDCGNNLITVEDTSTTEDD